jgi:hypothetical protein
VPQAAGGARGGTQLTGARRRAAAQVAARAVQEGEADHDAANRPSQGGAEAGGGGAEAGGGGAEAGGGGAEAGGGGGAGGFGPRAAPRGLRAPNSNKFKHAHARTRAGAVRQDGGAARGAARGQGAPDRQDARAREVVRGEGRGMSN